MMSEDKTNHANLVVILTCFLTRMMLGEKITAKLCAVILFVGFWATAFNNISKHCKSCLFVGGSNRNRSCKASTFLLLSLLPLSVNKKRSDQEFQCLTVQSFTVALPIQQSIVRTVWCRFSTHLLSVGRHHEVLGSTAVQEVPTRTASEQLPHHGQWIFQISSQWRFPCLPALSGLLASSCCRKFWIGLLCLCLKVKGNNGSLAIVCIHQSQKEIIK